jgi:hypothetical protein
MKVPELRLVKTFDAKDYKTDCYGSRERNMLYEVRKFIDDNVGNYIGIMYYYDGTIKMMAEVNFLSGICDDCTIYHDEVEAVAIYKVVL